MTSSYYGLSSCTVYKLLFVCLLVIVLSVTSSKAQFLYTQNVSNSEDDITVFPGIVVQLTCQTDSTTAITWRLSDGQNRFFNTFNVPGSSTLGDFNLMAMIDGSLLISTATITAMNNVSLECEAGANTSSIAINIKPIVSQVSLIQNITNDDTNITVCPGTPITFTCQTTTGQLIWLINNGSNRTLTNIGQMESLGNFTLSVTNITRLLLLVESVGSIDGVFSDFMISCSTGSGDFQELSTSIYVTIRSRPSLVSSLNIIQVCHDRITLNWTSIAPIGSPDLDNYQLTISPSMSTIMAMCSSNGVCTVLDTMTVVTGLLANTGYTFSVSGVNCDNRIGQAVQVSQTITTREPPVPELVQLNIIPESSNTTTSTIFVQWKPTISTDCLQPPVTSFIILVTGVLRTTITVDSTLTNTTTTVPACGVSAVTVSAVNNAGTSDRSDPLVFTGSVLTLSSAATSVDSESASLSITITECLRNAVDNITITYRLMPNFGFTRTIRYPNDSASAIVRLTDLESSTVYNATVIVYYRDDGRIKTLGPQTIRFSTTQSFFSFREAVIAGLATGFGISLIIITILIVLMVVFCYFLRKQHKRGETLRKKLQRLTVRQKEIQLEVQDIKENAQRIQTAQQKLPKEKEQVQMATLTNVVTHNPEQDNYYTS